MLEQVIGWFWRFNCTIHTKMERYFTPFLLISLAIVLCGSMGAFFMNVPILPTFGTAAILVALVTMFGLGYYTGQDRQAVAQDGAASDDEHEQRRAA